MSQKRYIKLVMTSADNNNKYYVMEYDGTSSSFQVTYGRVESTATKVSYNISKWESKYKEKIKKGYKDVTLLFTEEKDTNSSEPEVYETVKDAQINRFLSLMKKYTDGLVSKTYSVKAKNVTKAQIEEAQKFLDELKKIPLTKTIEINNKLLELYMAIPRYMSNVRDHLLPNIKLENILEKEQDNIDAIASQVKLVVKPVTKKKEKQTLLDVLGLTMTEIKEHENIKYLTDQLTGKYKIKSIFEVNKKEHTSIFKDWVKSQKNKKTRYLLHGTRCSSVIPILEQGLKIRPTGNYQFSGKVYGDGNYFSETCSKSLNYTGYDNDKVLLVYEVHTGNPFLYDGWFRGNSFTLSEKNLRERGFDSTFVKAGNGLLNSEIIVYNEKQCHIKYIIWL